MKQLTGWAAARAAGVVVGKLAAAHAPARWIARCKDSGAIAPTPLRKTSLTLYLQLERISAAPGRRYFVIIKRAQAALKNNAYIASSAPPLVLPFNKKKEKK